MILTSLEKVLTDATDMGYNESVEWEPARQDGHTFAFAIADFISSDSYMGEMPCTQCGRELGNCYAVWLTVTVTTMGPIEDGAPVMFGLPYHRKCEVPTAEELRDLINTWITETERRSTDGQLGLAVVAMVQSGSVWNLNGKRYKMIEVG